MGSRRLLVAGLAGIAVGACVAARAWPGLRRSFETSSSPGARCYDLLAGPLMGGLYDDIASEVATTLATAGVTNPRILEIGPGPGHVAERILGMLRGAHWTGLDIDPAMLDAARARLTRAGLADRATLVEGDVAAMPFEDAAFDLVVSSFSAHHWPDAEAGFASIRRVLRAEGVALVYDLPETWAHRETGSLGTGAAAGVFPVVERSTVRGVGPWTIVHRVRLSVPA
jgi:ubiquinone/menaquinone biosynthesis C-methylase UbiE